MIPIDGATATFIRCKGKTKQVLAGRIAPQAKCIGPTLFLSPRYADLNFFTGFSISLSRKALSSASHGKIFNNQGTQALGA
jgi:hypothetical protein